MDSILKSFSIGFLLRSVFSGVFFVVSYYVASHNPVDLSTIDGKTLLSLWLPVALFAGVTTYGLHRSLFYPVIECWHDSDRGKALRQRMPLIRLSTIHILLWRWSADEATTPILRRPRQNRHFNTWADFIHLQYTSALCIILGAIVGGIIVPGKHLPYWPLIGFAALLFIAAFISDWRTHSVLDHLRNEPNNALQPTAGTPCS